MFNNSGSFRFLSSEGWSEKPVKQQDKLGQLGPDVFRILSLYLVIKNDEEMN